MAELYELNDGGVLVPVSEQLGANSPIGSPVRNRYTGQGRTRRDPSEDTNIERIILGAEMLERAYRHSDMTRKIGHILPDDALARGIQWENADVAQALAINDWMAEYDMQERLRMAGVWSRIFGDSYAYVDDGGPEDAPFGGVDDYQIGSFAGLPVFTGFDIIPNPDSVSRQFGSAGFGAAQQLMLREGRDDFRPIDPGRVVRTSYVRPPLGGWAESEASGIRINGQSVNRSQCGAGIMDSVMPLIMGELEGVGAVRKLVTQASILDLEVEGFETLMQSNVNEAMSAADMIREGASVFGMHVHPKGTTLSRIAVSFAGLDAVLLKNIERVAMAIDAPHGRFVGSDPAGLNASGEASTKRWGSKVASFQREVYDPILKVVVPLMAKDLGMTDVAWSWPSYVEKPDKEAADETKVKVETLSEMTVTYRELIEEGFLTEDDARESIAAYVKSLTAQEA